MFNYCIILLLYAVGLSYHIIRTRVLIAVWPSYAYARTSTPYFCLYTRYSIAIATLYLTSVHIFGVGLVPLSRMRSRASGARPYRVFNRAFPTCAPFSYEPRLPMRSNEMLPHAQTSDPLMLFAMCPALRTLLLSCVG